MALDPAERAQIPLIQAIEPRVFNLGDDRWEGVGAIYTGERTARLRVGRDRPQPGIASSWNRSSTARILFGIIWIVASAAAGVADGPLHLAAAGRFCIAARAS